MKGKNKGMGGIVEADNATDKHKWSLGGTFPTCREEDRSPRELSNLVTVIYLLNNNTSIDPSLNLWYIVLHYISN